MVVSWWIVAFLPSGTDHTNVDLDVRCNVLY